VNLLFFLMLATFPGRPEKDDGAEAGILSGLVPRTPLGSAAMAVLVSTSLAVGLIFVGTHAFENYGWGVFLGIPFGLGLASAVIYGYHEPRTLPQCLGVAALSVVLAGVVLLAVALEGLICIIMAAPLAFGLAMIGAVIGYVVQARPARRQKDLTKTLGIFAALPVLLGAERVAAPEPDLVEVTTVVEIDASPERVWPCVIAFAELPPPEETLFRAGIAYPIRAEIFGEGPGAIRHCTFSTGAFVEPIEVWDPPQRLKFGVTTQPPAMKELSPWPGIQPAHVNDFLVTRAGEFLLTPLPGGRTRLTGTTWYAHRMWPAAYWKIWSDSIIHAIHRRVLEHIRRRAESP